MSFVFKSFTLSRIAIFFIAIITGFYILKYDKWTDENGVITSDVILYYAYLPAAFIYNDISLEFTKDEKTKGEFRIWPLKDPTKKHVLKMSMGVAYLYAPFFVVGHWYAKLSGNSALGYSKPYHIALMISSLCYLIIGFVFLKKLLKMFFNEFVTAFTILLIFIGTNLFYYATLQSPMSHVYSFSLITVFVFYTIKWHQKTTLTRTIILGVLLGIISLIRPTNVIVGLFLLLYNIKSVKDIKERFFFFIKKFPRLIIMAICAVLIWLPQFYYWKTVTGQWMFYSYRDENFFFNSPEIIYGLFSYKKGWLLYTPLMFFAIVGIIISYKHLKQLFFPTVIFFVFNIYIIFSWWCWWYGGSLGQRVMIDSYGIMAIFLALFIHWIWQKKFWIKIPFLLLILLTAFMSVIYTIQYKSGALHYDAMGKKAYWDNFGHLEPHGNYWSDIECPDYDKAMKGMYEIKKCD